MWRRSAATGAAAMLVVLCAAPSAEAQERLQWSDDWSRVHPVSYAVGGLGAALGLSLEALVGSDDANELRGPILLDDDVRSALRAPEGADRARAAEVSDWLLAATLLWPFVDSWVVAGIADENPDVSWQLSAIALQTYAATLLLNRAVKVVVNRERPYGRECGEREETPQLEQSESCRSRDRLRSFYSGHAAGAFSGAGLVCVSHAYLPLYQSQAADGAACAASLLVAGTVAVLRMVADRHYVSDVLVGAIVGVLAGVVLPWATTFGLDPDASTGAIRTPGASGPLISVGGSL